MAKKASTEDLKAAFAEGEAKQAEKKHYDHSLDAELWRMAKKNASQ